MNSRIMIWWLCFFPLGLGIQAIFPGLDALITGLIITMQERRYKDLFWVLPLLIIVQEGMGSREFGGMVLWYALTMGLFVVGRWLFEVQNFLFVFLISSCLGAGHLALSYILAPLQDLQVNLTSTTDESIVQALFIPVAWWLAYLSRRWTHVETEAA